MKLNYTQTVTVGEHTIRLPDLPANNQDILFIDEPDTVHWDRDKLLKQYPEVWLKYIPYFTEMYTEATLRDEWGNLKSLNKEDSDLVVRTYEMEMSRRTNGVHIKIGSKIVYLTGNYWFVLMWGTTKRDDRRGQYFDYRVFQRDFYYLIDHVNISDDKLGAFISKPKKTGVTNLMWLYYLNKSTMTKNINLGCMNIDQDKAAKTFRDHFLFAFNNLPLPLKPEVKTLKTDDGVITFGKRYNSSQKRNKVIGGNTDDELNTTVMCVATLPHAFDVDIFTDIWYDEPPKYKQDFGEIYRSNMAGTSIQDFIVGKIWLTSYTPEESSTSFFSARELFYNSKLSTRALTGSTQTTSKLICYHIPAFKSWRTEIDPKTGECNEVNAMKKIEEGRKVYRNNPRELAGTIRMYANTEKEAWSTSGVGSVFDNMLLSELLSDVEQDQRDDPRGGFKEFNLLWTVEAWNILGSRRRKGEFAALKKIYITDDERERGIHGKYREYFPMAQSQENLALKQGRDDEGNLLPPIEFGGVTGIDPTNYAASSEVIEGSKNSAFHMSLPKEAVDAYMRAVVTKVFDIEYYERPELPDEAFEDLLKLILYTGSLILCEANAPYVATRLMEEGLGYYMLIKDSNGIMMPWERWMGMPSEAGKQYQLIRNTSNSQSNKGILEDMVRVIKNYIRKPVQGEKNYGKTIKSERFLKQAMDFDATDTKKSDAVMGAGYTLLGMEVYLALLMEFKEDYSGSAYNALMTALSRA